MVAVASKSLLLACSFMLFAASCSSDQIGGDAVDETDNSFAMTECAKLNKLSYVNPDSSRACKGGTCIVIGAELRDKVGGSVDRVIYRSSEYSKVVLENYEINRESNVGDICEVFNLDCNRQLQHMGGNSLRGYLSIRPTPPHDRSWQAVVTINNGIFSSLEFIEIDY